MDETRKEQVRDFIVMVLEECCKRDTLQQLADELEPDLKQPPPTQAEIETVMDEGIFIRDRDGDARLTTACVEIADRLKHVDL
jgi:hypothetical protein